MADHNQIGSWGEQIAAEYLERKGFRILWRDWRDGHRDIDIIAIDADFLVFIEVKTRRNANYIEPEQAVNTRKMHNVGLAAAKFIRHYKYEMPIRFDIVAITGLPNSELKINHIEDAFRPY